jgi:hypothetical protein
LQSRVERLGRDFDTASDTDASTNASPTGRVRNRPSAKRGNERFIGQCLLTKPPAEAEQSALFPGVPDVRQVLLIETVGIILARRDEFRVLCGPVIEPRLIPQNITEDRDVGVPAVAEEGALRRVLRNRLQNVLRVLLVILDLLDELTARLLQPLNGGDTVGLVGFLLLNGLLPDSGLPLLCGTVPIVRGRDELVFDAISLCHLLHGGSESAEILAKVFAANHLHEVTDLVADREGRVEDRVRAGDVSLIYRRCRFSGCLLLCLRGGCLRVRGRGPLLVSRWGRCGLLLLLLGRWLRTIKGRTFLIGRCGLLWRRSLLNGRRHDGREDFFGRGSRAVERRAWGIGQDLSEHTAIGRIHAHPVTAHAGGWGRGNRGRQSRTSHRVAVHGGSVNRLRVGHIHWRGHRHHLDLRFLLGGREPKFPMNIF